MFPRRYFPGSYFAGRYFAQSSALTLVNIHAIPEVDPSGDFWVFDESGLDLSHDFLSIWQ